MSAISVIIPAYNAEKFIKKAIHSVASQQEVVEIIVIDDGSTDSTFAIVSELQISDKRIKIYYHLDHKNRGRSASRNLGVQKATGEYIAFLDADDFYLPNRFGFDLSMFINDSSCDGVYNAVGFHFYKTAKLIESEIEELYTVSRKMEPELLFKNLLYGKCGHFHIDGLTVKKSVFESIGLFNEELTVAEDTDIFWKMAIKCNLKTGIITEAVAKRGVHDSNIFDNEALYKIYHIKMHESVARWCGRNKIDIAVIDDLLKWIWMLKYKQGNKLRADIIDWAKFFFNEPRLLFSIMSIKYFPIVRYRKKLFPFFYKSSLNP